MRWIAKALGFVAFLHSRILNPINLPWLTRIYLIVSHCSRQNNGLQLASRIAKIGQDGQSQTRRPSGRPLKSWDDS